MSVRGDSTDRDLSNEDVSTTMYKETLRNKVLGPEHTQKPSTSEDKNMTSKVNKICDSFLQTLKSRTATNLQNIITAHVCKTPPDFEAGLLEVSRLQSR